MTSLETNPLRDALEVLAKRRALIEAEAAEVGDCDDCLTAIDAVIPALCTYLSAGDTITLPVVWEPGKGYDAAMLYLYIGQITAGYVCTVPMCNGRFQAVAYEPWRKAASSHTTVNAAKAALLAGVRRGAP